MIFGDALAYLFDGSHWAGRGGLLQRLGETLGISLVSLLIVIVIAVPLGVLIGHTGRGRRVAIVSSNIARALPTLGLLSILLLVLGVNPVPVAVVLIILGIPPMLAGVYSGFESVNRATIDAARAVGMTEFQIVTRVEAPLAAPLLVGGLRSTTLQIVATTTVASAFAFGGLGYPIVSGIASNNFVVVLAGAILVTVLCLIIDGLLSIVQRLVAPRGVPRDGADSATPKARTRAGRARATAPGSPLQEGMQS